MPVQGKPQIPPPYWVMPPPKPAPPPAKQEYCAICELKDLVDRIGQNLCYNCSTCNGGAKRPVTACVPVPQPPVVDEFRAPIAPPPYTRTPEHTIPCPYQYQQPQTQVLPCANPVPTYQWPQYSKGLACPPQQEMADYLSHLRQHPYLPVKIDTQNEDRALKIRPRAKSATDVFYNKNQELRSSMMVTCECTKKNGLQDTCPRLVCKDTPKLRDSPSKTSCVNRCCKRKDPPPIEEENECKEPEKIQNKDAESVKDVGIKDACKSETDAKPKEKN